MRITQIMLSRGFGGAERAFMDTSMALADRGHTVQVICRSSFTQRGKLEVHPGIEVFGVSLLNQYDWISMLRIRAAMKRFRPAVAHIHLNRAARLGGRAAVSAGIPWVGTFHNYYSMGNYIKAAAVFTISSDVQRHAIAQGSFAQSLAVVPNFSRIRPVERVHARAGGPVRILSYGRFVPEKGFDILLKAFKSLLDSGVEAELVLGGDGPDDNKLRTLCRNLKLDHHLIYKGWIDDIQKELDEASLFVLSSRHETFGLVMLEAMARGVPIVTTRSQGPEQILSDQTAFFAEIESVKSLSAAMQEAAENPGLAIEKAEAALDLYRTTYREDVVLPQMEDLYRQIADMKGPIYSVIELTNDLIFAEGGRRKCFLYPDDSERCIKTLSEHGDPAGRRQTAVWYKRFRPLATFDDNLRELESFNKLAAAGEEVWEHFPRCFGMVPTRRGRGIVTQLIRDEGGEISQNVRDYVKTHGKTPELRAALEPFFDLLRRQVVLTRDILDHNIVVQITSSGLTVFMIDGFGSSDAFPFSSWSRRIGLRKVNRKINKFCNRYGF